MTFVQETAERWYVVLESQATRPHYQMYIQFKTKYKSLNAMRNKVKKILSGQGNRAYSISEVKEKFFPFRDLTDLAMMHHLESRVRAATDLLTDHKTQS